MKNNPLAYPRQGVDTLSYKGQPLRTGRHKLHPYPAMLHPLLIDYLLDKYARTGDTVFDPFCGSGVTLFQAATKQHRSIGYDINPLALLIADAKTTTYNLATLEQEFHRFKQLLRRAKATDVPKITNMEYWYAPEVVTHLGIIRNLLIQHEWQYLSFFMTCFALICRKHSYTRQGEFKRHRAKDPAKIAKAKVVDAFLQHTEAMLTIFAATNKKINKPKIKLCNSEGQAPNGFDLVITSPPYGDSRTTVAYGEFSSFALEWILDINPFGPITSKVDKESLGKKNGSLKINLDANLLLQETIDQISRHNHQRALDVLFFFNGLYNAINQTLTKLRAGGTVCYVVGNRTVAGQTVPMDQITASFLEEAGLRLQGIFVREITGKTLPLENSPTNKSGMVAKTMHNEFIVVFAK